MAKFKDNILAIAGDEAIEAIVIGDMGWEDYGTEGKPEFQQVKGKLLTWQEAVPYLDYEHDTGYGAPGCQAITAWTKNKVLFVWTYDGATGVTFVPRNPVEHMPDMPGG